MPGPKPTPTRILELRGSWRAKTRAGELKPSSENIRKPSYLTGEAAKKWRETAPGMIKLGLLTINDVDTWARYCIYFSAWEKAVRADFSDGLTPAHRWLCKMLDDLGRQFGLTPVSRIGLKVKTEPEPDGGKGYFRKA